MAPILVLECGDSFAAFVFPFPKRKRRRNRRTPKSGLPRIRGRGILLTQFLYLAADTLLERGIIGLRQHLTNPCADLAHLQLAYAARGQCRGADADPRWVER